MESRGQAAVEYLLLIALGLVIVIVGVAVALQIREFTDIVVDRVAIDRNATLAMIVRP
jgi:uncharacterized protein (UPF0333 family)